MTALLVHAGPVPLHELQQALRQELPDVPVRVWPEIGDAADISFALVSRIPHGFLSQLPALRLVGSLHAGVDHLLGDPGLPGHVPLVRPVPAEGGDPLMSEFILAQVLQHHRHLPAYAAAQREAAWEKYPPVQAAQRSVGLLGYGAMAAPAAALLAKVGFDVAAWARQPRTGGPIRVFSGPEGLREMLRRTQILVNLLPLTPQTRGIIDARLLRQLPQGAALVNVGRGEHVVEEDLLAALDARHLAGASLDVFAQEPLPRESLLWRHPRVLVTPHACRTVDVASVVAQFAGNVRRVQRGELPLQCVDRESGY